MKPKNSPTLNIVKGTSLNAASSNSRRVCAGCTRTFITVKGISRVPSMMKAITRVAQPKPIFGCSWAKMMG
jgi:hypothetical protein